MTLFDILPAPLHAPAPKVSKEENEQQQSDDKNNQQSTFKAVADTVPPYGHRKGWAPRHEYDFGGGGAFPEIHMAQYPPFFGNPARQSSNALVKTFDTQGNPQYESLLTQAPNAQKVIHATPLAMQSHSLDLSKYTGATEEEIANTTQKTVQALSGVLNKKIATSMIVNPIEK